MIRIGSRAFVPALVILIMLMIVIEPESFHYVNRLKYAQPCVCFGGFTSPSDNMILQL